MAKFMPLKKRPSQTSSNQRVWCPLNQPNTKFRFYHKLAFRFILVIVIILITLVLLLNLFSIYNQTEILTNTLESKARTITEIVALTCSNAIIGGDFTFLDESINAVAKDVDVAYGLIVDRDNYVLVHTNKAFLQQKLTGEIDEKAVTAKQLELVTYYNDELRTEVIDSSFPIFLRSGEKWGVVRFGFSKTRLNRSIQEAYQLTGLSAIVFIFVGIMIAVFLSKNITRPVETLVKQATQVAQGDLDKKIQVSSKGEIVVLAEAFDDMRISLKNKITQLARKIDELSTLHDVGMAITSTLNVEPLIKRILDATTKTLGFSRALIFLIDEETGMLRHNASRGIADERTGKIADLEFSIKENQSVLSEVVHSGIPLVVRKGSYRSSEEKDFFELLESYETALLPLRVKEHEIGLFLVDKAHDTDTTIDEAEVILLSIFASQAAIAIENAQLYTATAQKERMEMELQTAKNIQMTLLPQSPPEIEGLDLAGICIPATEVGGDYYDFIELPNNMLGVAIGDVNGHGVPAGLIMALAKSSLRTQARNDYHPAIVLPILNNVLYEAAQRKLLMTFFYALLDLNSHTLTYSNAGHNFPYHFSAEENKLEEIMLGGPPLGFKKGRQYHNKKIRVKKDDVLIFYSDGIVEAENPGRDMYDYDRFEKVIKGNCHKSAFEIQQVILEELHGFCDGAPYEDDITLVVVKIMQ